MLGLPKSTEFNKRIPKQKFYDNLTVSPTLKRIFVDQIRIIYWANKIAPSTLNLAEGKNVTEIEVFHIQLNQETLYENVLKQIDREIPYHILFVLEYDGKYKAVMGYKEAAGSGKASFKVDRYYQTEWMPETNLPVHLDGLNIDAVYENFVRQIAGDVLQAATPQESLKEYYWALLLHIRNYLIKLTVRLRAKMEARGNFKNGHLVTILMLLRKRDS